MMVMIKAEPIGLGSSSWLTQQRVNLLCALRLNESSDYNVDKAEVASTALQGEKIIGDFTFG